MRKSAMASWTYALALCGCGGRSGLDSGGLGHEMTSGTADDAAGGANGADAAETPDSGLTEEAGMPPTQGSAPESGLAPGNDGAQSSVIDSFPVCQEGCCAGPDAGTSGQTVLADSVNGFSGMQGGCGWSYGYQPGGAEPFTLVTIYDTTQYVRPSPPNGPVWEESVAHPPWIVTFNVAQHPNESPLQWNDRRWTSTGSGTISIQGHLAKADTEGGDGIIGHIRVGGTEIWNATLAYDDSVGVNFDLTAGVEVGTPVDFLVDPRETDLYDTTTLTAIIAISGASSGNVP